jgi:hypothetical protein
MTKMGQLSPIDPSIEHPLAPIVQIPGQPGGRFAPVSVEDVNAFIELARSDFGLTNECAMTKVFEILASRVNPLVLGAVGRSRAQIAFLASTLMKCHIDDEKRIERCVEALIRQRFSHDYIIGRREAKEVLGLNIVDPDPDFTRVVVSLYGAYNEIVMMDKPYHPEVVLGKDSTRTADFNRAVVESASLTHVYRTRKEITRVQIPQPGIPYPVVCYQENVLQEEWIQDNTL